MYLHPLILIPILVIRHVAAQSPGNITTFKGINCEGSATTSPITVPEIGQNTPCLIQGGQSFRIVTIANLNTIGFNSVEVATFSNSNCEVPHQGTDATCAYYGNRTYEACGSQQYPEPTNETCINIPFATLKAEFFSFSPANNIDPHHHITLTLPSTR